MSDLLDTFTAKLPSWANTLAPRDAAAKLQRADDVATAVYAMATQTGIHSTIEWCGVMKEHVKMLREGFTQGVDPSDLNQHSGTAVQVPVYMVDYFCEKLGCQLKPFIHADKKAWRRAIDLWFKE